MESEQLIRLTSSELSKWKVHIATRLIAHYVSKGDRGWYIYPLFRAPEFDWMIEEGSTRVLNEKRLILMLLDKWPERKMREFSPYPVIRLLERLSVVEQLDVLELLRSLYGFKRVQPE